MCKRIEEQREVTRGTLVRHGQWVLTLLLAAFVFAKPLGIAYETIKTLQTIFTLLVSMEVIAFGYYFVRRSTR